MTNGHCADNLVSIARIISFLFEWNFVTYISSSMLCTCVFAFMYIHLS